MLSQILAPQTLNSRRPMTLEEVRTFAGDERYELAHALLHALLGLLCDFGILGECRLHDPGDWSKVMNVSIVIEVLAVGVPGDEALLGLWGRGRSLRGWRRHGLSGRPVGSLETDAADRWLAKEPLIRQDVQNRRQRCSVIYGQEATPVTAVDRGAGVKTL